VSDKLDEIAERTVSNGECAAQLEIKDATLRESMVRNVRAALEEAEAEVERLTRDMTQLEKWSEGLVIETQRLQGIEAEVEQLREQFLAENRDALEQEARAEKAEAEVERLRAQVESLLHRMTSEEAASEIERLRAALEELKWLGENWPAFWIVMPGWALAEKYHAAVSTLRALRGEGEKPTQ
jgi:DNA repair exonuclease SbcCD ATPase subunit